MYMIIWVTNDKEDYFLYTLIHAASPSPHIDKHGNKHAENCVT